jgi:hypothetical protein
MIATNMGRAPYSSEVQQPERQPRPCMTVDRRRSLRRQRQSWAVPMFCIQVVWPRWPLLAAGQAASTDLTVPPRQRSLPGCGAYQAVAYLSRPADWSSSGDIAIR